MYYENEVAQLDATLRKYGREVTVSTAVFHSVSDSSGGPLPPASLPFHQYPLQKISYFYTRYWQRTGDTSESTAQTSGRLIDAFLDAFKKTTTFLLTRNGCSPSKKKKSPSRNLRLSLKKKHKQSGTHVGPPRPGVKAPRPVTDSASVTPARGVGGVPVRATPATGGISS
ncbi:hypothetical protein EVAR_3302_1 [Eumeta japonica]|uniref:Uncharacterized protein n=1 Tax=Eumeta variegata TaxID=151549 RepID=A0A4C1SV66_EUMVA|nr:hypothetical protein EVAR_3302_1 [Eumeta japonica]